MVDLPRRRWGWAVLVCGAGILLAGCSRQYVLSPYASTTEVSRARDGQLRLRSGPHRGVDIRANDKGDPVIAAADGIVVAVDYSRDVGYTVTVDHGDSALSTRYVHLETLAVDVGDFVDRGDVLGAVGLFSKRESQVVRVHFEVCTNTSCRGAGPLGGTVDPARFLVGCFTPDRSYAADELTYPVECDGTSVASSTRWPRSSSARAACPIGTTFVDEQTTLGFVGCVDFTTRREHGRVAHYDESGCLRARGIMDQGRRTGIWVSWSPAGDAQVSRFVRGLPQESRTYPASRSARTRCDSGD